MGMVHISNEQREIESWGFAMIVLKLVLVESSRIVMSVLSDYIVQIKK